MSLYIYTRVSTYKQANNEAYGLDKQYEICKNYAKNVLKINTIVEHYEDIGSGYCNKNILTYQNKLARNILRDSTILIHSVSRIGRNIEKSFKFLNILKSKNVNIISVTDNAFYGKSVLLNKNFYRSLITAEEESDIKSEKMKARIHIIKQMGGHIGRVPYGYKLVELNGIPMLSKNAKEQKIIKIIKTLISKNHKYCDIANYLNSKNYKKKDLLWTDKNVRTVKMQPYVHYKISKSSDILTEFNEMNL